MSEQPTRSDADVIRGVERSAGVGSESRPAGGRRPLEAVAQVGGGTSGDSVRSTLSGTHLKPRERGRPFAAATARCQLDSELRVWDTADDALRSLGS